MRDKAMNIYRTDNKTPAELASREAKLKYLARELAHYFDIDEIDSAVTEAESNTSSDDMPDWLLTNYCEHGLFIWTEPGEAA
jgi:hypothetical protein